jgi:hypothetical protein
MKMINKLILISILFLAIPLVNATTTTSSTTTTKSTTTTSICCGPPLSCSGTSTHYCSPTYKSIDSIDKIIAPTSANCGSTIPVTIEWTGRHNGNENHWGFFLQYDYQWYPPPNNWGYIGSCKSQPQPGEGMINKFNMLCNLKMPTPGINNPFQEGANKLMVTGEDYGGYCNPDEAGVDAQNSADITLLNCKTTTTTTISSTTTIPPQPTTIRRPLRGSGGSRWAIPLGTSDALNNPFVIVTAIIVILIIIVSIFSSLNMMNKKRR